MYLTSLISTHQHIKSFSMGSHKLLLSQTWFQRSRIHRLQPSLIHHTFTNRHLALLGQIWILNWKGWPYPLTRPINRPFFEKGSGVYNSTRCRSCFSGNKSLWHLLCWLVETFMLWITKPFWGMESNLPEITTAFFYSFPTTTTVSYIYNDFGRQAEPGKLWIFGGFNKCEAVALVYLLWNRINGRDSYSSCMDL